MAQAAPFISMASTAVSTGLAVASFIQQNRVAQAQAAAARQNALYQAQVAKNNAILSERLAQDAIDRGEVDARRHRMQVRQLQARQEAQFAGQGLEVGVGSPLDTFTDTARTGALDAFAIQQNAEREALGLKTQGANFRAQEGLLRLESQAPAPPGALLGAGATALGGVSSVTTQFIDFKQAGVI